MQTMSLAQYASSLFCIESRFLLSSMPVASPGQAAGRKVSCARIWQGGWFSFLNFLTFR